MTKKVIPPGVIGVMASIISQYHTHATMDALFMAAGCPGEAPDGNKNAKAMEWLSRANKECEKPLEILGYVLGDLLDSRTATDADELHPGFVKDRDQILRVLRKNDLSYRAGGKLFGQGLAGPSRSLAEDIKARGIDAIDQEFERAYATVESDPPAAVTAACAIVESVCKTYLESVGEPLPSKQSIDPLWTATAKHLGLDPSILADIDLKKILSGLFNIAQGVGALRTHAGSAHGQSGATTSSGTRYRLSPRHARLAVHAAHTLALFTLETWDARRQKQTRTS